LCGEKRIFIKIRDMSRGFVKEEDQEEAPFIPPRAALPAGVTNYVTSNGYEALVREREQLEEERKQLDIKSDKDRRHAQAVIDGKLNLLKERLNAARILKMDDQPQDEVRFGATVTFKNLSAKGGNSVQSFQIVGVDEADIKKKKIAFLAPLARALTGKKTGEQAEVLMAGKTQTLEIVEIVYV
jgi:transcription elongation factor GreB